MPYLTSLQSGVVAGDIVRPSLTNFVGFDGLLFKQTGPGVTGTAGYAQAQIVLPATTSGQNDGNIDQAKFLLVDGGRASASPYSNQLRPLVTDHEVLIWLNGAATAGDVLVLAPVLTRATITSPTGATFSSTAGMVQSIATVAVGLVFTAPTITKGGITGVNITGGTCYTNNTPVIATDPTGVGFLGSLQVNASGVPTGVTVINPGSGYTAPVFNLAPVKYVKVGYAAVNGVDAQLVLVNPEPGAFSA